MQFLPLCECCIIRKGLSCWSLHSFESLGSLPDHHGHSLTKLAPWSHSPACGIPPPRVTLEGEELEQPDWPPCIACKSGDNSIGHWTRWCPVPLVVAGLLLNDMSSMSLSQLSARGSKELIVTTHVVHQFRRLLIDMGAFQHGEPIHMATGQWIQ